MAVLSDTDTKYAKSTWKKKGEKKKERGEMPVFNPASQMQVI